jgi:hypothetical protein
VKINLDNMPPHIEKPTYGVEIGNVYRNQKGNLYVIVSVLERPGTFDGPKATALVVDRSGEVTNVVCYTVYYFSRLTIIGHALNIPSEIEIEWVE